MNHLIFQVIIKLGKNRLDVVLEDVCDEEVEGVPLHVLGVEAESDEQIIGMLVIGSQVCILGKTLNFVLKCDVQISLLEELGEKNVEPERFC